MKTPTSQQEHRGDQQAVQLLKAGPAGRRLQDDQQRRSQHQPERQRKRRTAPVARHQTPRAERQEAQHHHRQRKLAAQVRQIGPQLLDELLAEDVRRHDGFVLPAGDGMHEALPRARIPPVHRRVLLRGKGQIQVKRHPQFRQQDRGGHRPAMGQPGQRQQHRQQQRQLEQKRNALAGPLPQPDREGTAALFRRGRHQRSHQPGTKILRGPDRLRRHLRVARLQAQMHRRRHHDREINPRAHQRPIPQPGRQSPVAQRAAQRQRRRYRQKQIIIDPERRRVGTSRPLPQGLVGASQSQLLRTQQQARPFGRHNEHHPQQDCGHRKIPEQVCILQHNRQGECRSQEQQRLVVGQPQPEQEGRQVQQRVVLGPAHPHVDQQQHPHLEKRVEAVHLHNHALRPQHRTERQQQAAGNPRHQAQRVFRAESDLVRQRRNAPEQIRARAADQQRQQRARPGPRHRRGQPHRPGRIGMSVVFDPVENPLEKPGYQRPDRIARRMRHSEIVRGHRQLAGVFQRQRRRQGEKIDRQRDRQHDPERPPVGAAEKGARDIVEKSRLGLGGQLLNFFPKPWSMSSHSSVGVSP